MTTAKVQSDEQRASGIPSLPRWAQEHIAGLERKVAGLTERVAELSEGPAGSDTVVDGMGVYPDRELGTGVAIGFRLPGGRVNARVRGDYLEIRDRGDGVLGALVVQPQSSNVVRVRQGEWW